MIRPYRLPARRSIAKVSALIVLACVTSPAFGDVVALKNGRRIQADSTREERGYLRLEFKSGSTRIARSEIDWVIIGTPEEIDRKRRTAGFFEAGRVALRDGRFAEAADWFKQAAEAEPSNADILNNYAAALAQAGKPDRAAAVLRSALAIDPHHAASKINLAELLVDAGEYDRASELLGEAGRSSGADADLHNRLGVALLKGGRYTTAVRSLRDAVAYEPDNARYLNNLGCALSASGQDEAAADIFREALSRDPRSEEAQRNLEYALHPKQT